MCPLKPNFGSPLRSTYVRRTAWAAAEAAAADEQRTLSAEIINRARVQFLPSSIMPIFDTFSPAAAGNAVPVVDLPIFHRFGADGAAAAAHVLIFPHSLAKALHDGSEGVLQLSPYRMPKGRNYCTDKSRTGRSNMVGNLQEKFQRSFNHSYPGAVQLRDCAYVWFFMSSNDMA